MSTQYYDAIPVDIVTGVRRAAALLKTGTFQHAIFNRANFSSIATDEKGMIQLFNVGAEALPLAVLQALFAPSRQWELLIATGV